MNPRNERLGSPVRDGHPRRKERGSVLVEFVLSFLLFFLVTIVGTMDLGQGIWANNALAHAAHEGVRYAIVRGADSLSPATESDIRDYVRSKAPFLGSSNVNVSVTWTPDTSPGSTVEVTASYTFQPLISVYLSDVTLSSTAQLVMTN